MSDLNLLVNVRCPHCNKRVLVALSGFAGELATRHKECKYCGQEYHVHLVSVTSTATTTPTDGEIASAKARIRYLQEQRKQTLAELLLKQELSVRLYNESLQMAREMRAKADVN